MSWHAVTENKHPMEALSLWERHVWTISRDAQPGWQTDGGYPGYGLTKELAEWLIAAANAYEKTVPSPQEKADE